VSGDYSKFVPLQIQSRGKTLYVTVDGRELIQLNKVPEDAFGISIEEQGAVRNATSRLIR